MTSSFALHKLSFACMKTKFSPVGDIILDCQCQCQRIVKKNIILTHPLLTLTLTVRFSAPCL